MCVICDWIVLLYIHALTYGHLTTEASKIPTIHQSNTEHCQYKPIIGRKFRVEIKISGFSDLAVSRYCNTLPKVSITLEEFMM